MKKIIIALLVIAVVFYAMLGRSENIVFIKKHTTGFLKLNIAPFFFKSSNQVVDFSFSLGVMVWKLFWHQLAH